MNARHTLMTLSLLGSAAHPLLAGEPAAEVITQNPAPSRLRFGAAYAPIVGMKTEFGGLGRFNSAFTPQPLGGGRDYDYDDGFVHVDSSGNLGGETWNWGYDNAPQIDPSGSGSLALSITNSSANAGASDDNQAESGIEFFAYYEMGPLNIPALKSLNATWGFRGGFHYAHVDTGNTSTLTSGTVTVTDRYNLNGTIPPLAPYSGSFGGPGPLIGDSPARTTGAGATAFVDGSRDLNVHLTTLNFGSYLEVPVSGKFSVTLEGGLSAAFASGSYDYESSTSIAGLGTRTSSGSDSELSLLPGVYLGMSGIYQINDSWSLQAAGRYQYLDSLELESNGSNATLSFDSAFVLSLGAMYSF
ncbi:MAG: hypothetical protein ABIT37_11825 [Luteolibacter sp.]